MEEAKSPNSEKCNQFELENCRKFQSNLFVSCNHVKSEEKAVGRDAICRHRHSLPKKETINCKYIQIFSSSELAQRLDAV